MWIILKVFIEYVTIFLSFYLFIYLFLAMRHVCFLAPQPGIKPSPLALEGEVLTTGPPESPVEMAFENYFTHFTD